VAEGTRAGRLSGIPVLSGGPGLRSTFEQLALASADRDSNAMIRPSRPLHHPALAAKIARLRELVVSAKNLAEASDYFHTTLVTEETFMAAGSPRDEPRLVEIVGSVLQALAPGGQPRRPMVLRLDGYGMCHGCMGWDRGLALFVYFDEPDMGVCSYQRDLVDPNVWFSRFSVVQSSGWAVMPRGSA
jgi:hypothetical protein